MWFDRWLKKGYAYVNTRRFIRLGVPWPIKCQLEAQPEVLHLTEPKDVSAGGAAVVVPEAAEVGSRVRVELQVPVLDRSIQAQGRVTRCTPTSSKWRRGFEWAIDFDRIPAADQEQLQEAIRQFYSPEEQHRQESGSWWRNI